VKLSQAVGQTSDPYGSWSGTDWQQAAVPEVAPGLVLEGYATRPEALEPGESLYVSLRWRASAKEVADCAPSLVISQHDITLERDAGRLFERYPTTRWAAGELLIETRELQMPATAEPVDILLDVNGDTVPVGKVAVARDALLWELPDKARPACARVSHVGSLIGYEWEAQPSPSAGKVVTLYWRASSAAPTATSYTVFVHLISPEGRLLAQHDGLPRRGERPTTTWLPGEVIADEHTLRPDTYAETAQPLIGMYDLQTGERLAAYDCAGHRLPDDAIPLNCVASEEDSQSSAVFPRPAQRRYCVARARARSAEMGSEALP
jgi:hypothetical protein